MLSSQGNHAVVIGASIAGLLAARVLAEHFDGVTIIERDTLPAKAESRKAVPQGEHVHLLMIRGAEILEQFFPGITAEIEASGSVPANPTLDFHWYHFGCWKLQFPGSLQSHSQSRPLLEFHVRRRVAGLKNVRFLQGKVVGYQHDAQSRTITGVYAQPVDGPRNTGRINAQLVIDASGRGSQTPLWLQKLGYPLVEETSIPINVGYATRVYRRPNVAHNWKLLGIYPDPAGEMKRTGYLFPIEDGRWIVTLSGLLGDHPSTEEWGFLEFARRLSQPDIYEAIKDAEPLTPIKAYKYPANLRRHYERFPMPDGLIVMGDATCSMNPIYGQGMTLASLEAEALYRELPRRRRTRSLQKALARVIKTPWTLTTSEDFRYPEVVGKRHFGQKILHTYTKRVARLTAHDPFITETFYSVLNMQRPPSALFHPHILFSALFSRKGR